MKLLRAFAESWREFSPEDTNDIAKTGWLSVAALLFTLFRDETHTFAEGESGLTIGEALYPDETSPPPSSAITLKEGLALIHDPALSDDYLGEVLPAWLEQKRTVEIPINTANSSRIVSVFVTYQQLETDERQRWFRDPEQEQVYREQTPHTIEWDAEIRVVEGTPGSGSAPSPPSDGGPWLRIANIDRPPGQTQVNSSEITDARNNDVAHLTELFLSFGLNLVRGASISIKDGSYLASLGVDEPEGWLALLEDEGSGLAYGDFKLSHLIVDVLQAGTSVANGDYISVDDKNGNAGQGNLWFNAVWPNNDRLKVRDQDGANWGEVRAGVFSAIDWFVGTTIKGTTGANNNEIDVLEIVNALAAKVEHLRGKSGGGNDEVHVRNRDDSAWGLLKAGTTEVVSQFQISSGSVIPFKGGSGSRAELEAKNTVKAAALVDSNGTFLTDANGNDVQIGFSGVTNPNTGVYELSLSQAAGDDQRIIVEATMFITGTTNDFGDLAYSTPDASTVKVRTYDDTGTLVDNREFAITVYYLEP